MNSPPSAAPPTKDDDATSVAARLRALTDARVMMGRAGVAVLTRNELAFRLDHARARHAVLAGFDAEGMAAALAGAGFDAAVIASRAGDRGTYIRRPDLGRLAEPDFEAKLASLPKGRDAALVVADGLSSTAVGLNALPLAEALARRFEAARIGYGPAVVAAQGRVALGDWIGEALQARVVVVLIGERPGLSAADSLGAYLTYAPAPGTPDSRRNCVSNIRARGLAVEAAADRIAALVGAMLAARASGVALGALDDARRIGA